MLRVLVTGGAGYVGSLLVPELLEKGYSVTVLDWFIFGDTLKKYKDKIRIVKGDIRESSVISKSLENVDYVIHLAGLSNDASSEIDKNITKSINYDASIKLIKLCERNSVKKFIFASSASVYGIKHEVSVSEILNPNPITLYAKLKIDVENYLLQKSSLNFTILRPATLCGSSPRLRLDLSINILTYNGFICNKIKVFGGKQFRPILNIKDMIRAYILCLKIENVKINRQIFNVSMGNYRINEMAIMVKKKLLNDPKIEILSSNDYRSYRLSSNKIFKFLNFCPKYGIDDAIDSITKELSDSKKIWSSDKYYNVRLVSKLISKGIVK